MRSLFDHMATPQNQDLVTVVNGAQTMGHKNAGTILVLQDSVDIGQKGLLRVGVEGRGL